MLNLEKIHNIHFVGIGGISMSCLAKLMLFEEKCITGSDKTFSENVKNLQTLGIKVKKNHFKDGVLNADIIVFSAAIPNTNKDIVWAKQFNKPLIERADFLGEIAKTYKQTIAISGTHGKTTTTAMIFECLKHLNPTLHVGGIVKNINNNLFYGNKNIFITEACEYNKSFLKLTPQISVITNIEKDHMECYKTKDNLINAFKIFAKNTSKIIIINNNLSRFFTKNFTNQKFLTVDILNDANYVAKNLTQNNGCFSFDVFKFGKFLGKVNLQIFGKHNVFNALFAIAVCDFLNVPFCVIKNGLEQFESVAQRFEILYDKDIKIIRDYAHHPTEIKAAINSALNICTGKLFCVFEPHTYSRTLNLFHEFLTCFNNADEIIFLPTYKAREKPIIGGKSKDLFNALPLQNKFYFKNHQDLNNYLLNNIKPNDIVLWLGAGTIGQFAKEFADNFYGKSF